MLSCSQFLWCSLSLFLTYSAGCQVAVSTSFQSLSSSHYCSLFFTFHIHLTMEVDLHKQGVTILTIWHSAQQVQWTNCFQIHLTKYGIRYRNLATSHSQKHLHKKEASTSSRLIKNLGYSKPANKAENARGKKLNLYIFDCICNSTSKVVNLQAVLKDLKVPLE